MEVAFIIPILVFLTLVIFEIALFWQELNSIYSINAEINANVALLDYAGTLAMGSVCPAADETKPNSAISIMKKKASSISLTNPTFATEIPAGFGNAPFALYKFSANPMTVGTTTKPQITLWVDCRNPFENGVLTQIEFYHKTLIMKASIPRFDGGSKITIIPDKIFIASPKLTTLRHY